MQSVPVFSKVVTDRRPLILAPIVPLALLLLFTVTTSIHGQTDDDFEQQKLTMTRLRNITQTKTLNLLLILKKLDEKKEVFGKRLKVIKQEAPVHESNAPESRTLHTAKYGDEFEETEMIDSWRHVFLPDGRDGWIEERFVQSITVPKKVGKVIDSQTEAAMVEIAERLNGMVQGLSDSAEVVYRQAVDQFVQLSEKEKSSVQKLMNEIEHEHDRLVGFSEYARHFTPRYAVRREPNLSQPSALRFPGPLSGELGINLGNSAYNTSYTESTKSSSSARTLFFNGAMTLSDAAQATAQLSHHRTVLQTPFTSNDIRLGFDYAFSHRTTINSYGVLGTYADDLSPMNDFARYELGANLRTPLGETTQFTSDLTFSGKSYKDESSNSYSGIQLLSNMKMKSGEESDWVFGLNAALQQSDISYLKFNRIAPSAQYLSRSGGRGFGIKAEIENMGYAGTSAGNDFLREQIDLVWSEDNVSRQVTIIGKQFPKNELQNYLRLQTQIRLRDQTGDSHSSANYSALFNFFTTSSGTQPHYIDLRSDASNVGSFISTDWSLFGRAWFDQKDTTDRDHILDTYARVGFQISSVNVGPLIGAHLQIRKDAKVFKRDGNSLRVGIDANGNFTIEKAQLRVNARYEKDFVYGRMLTIDRTTSIVNFGQLVERHPITFQFSIDLRYPLLPALDLTLNINRYEVHPDVNMELSADPIERRYQFNALVGANYRFDSK